MTSLHPASRIGCCHAEVSAPELPAIAFKRGPRPLVGRSKLLGPWRSCIACQHCPAQPFSLCDRVHHEQIAGRTQPVFASVAHRDARSHGYTHGSAALLRSSTDVPEPPVQRISRTDLDAPDQLQADSIPSRNRDGLAQFAWSSDESARHSATHELATGFFRAATSVIVTRGHYTS